MMLMFILRGVFSKFFQNISRPCQCLFAQTAQVRVNDVLKLDPYSAGVYFNNVMDQQMAL